MERNSLGQIVVNESGSLTLKILAVESTIPVTVYNRFLLDNKEFTELVPTVDKDALIRELSDRLNNSITTINTLINNTGSSAPGGSGTSGGGGGSLGGGGNNGNVFPL